MRIRGWALCSLLAASCAPADQGAGQAETQQDLEILTICAAARLPPGTRVRIAAEFDGFGYETESRRVTLKSSELCSERGAGLAFANLRSEAEGSKLLSTMPGTRISIEGEIERVEQERFIDLTNALVVSSRLHSE